MVNRHRYLFFSFGFWLLGREEVLTLYPCLSVYAYMHTYIVACLLAAEEEEEEICMYVGGWMNG